MPMKIGKDEFCLHCMDWREYDEEGKCKICKHIIHRETKKSENEGYDKLKTESPSFEELDEEVDDSDY